MRGILLAGGYSTRLRPATLVVNKHLLHVYDKPLIYYPLSLMMLAGIRTILVITTPEALPAFKLLLKDGSQWGVKISYIEQCTAQGIADAFVLGREFIGNEKVMLVLGDNIIYGHGLPDQLQKARGLREGAVVFAYIVKDPERYGVVEFDEEGNVISIQEKPALPRTNYAVPGIYFYDNQVVDIAANLDLSARGELEITDVNNVYIERGHLRVEVIGRGIAWLDAGTPESLLQAANYIQAIQERQGVLVASPEETAYNMQYITYRELHGLAYPMSKNSYRRYLREIPKNALQK